MKHSTRHFQIPFAAFALMCASHAMAQTPVDAPRKGVISPPTQPVIQPTVKPMVQTTTLPKSTKTWDYKRHHRKTVTGVFTPMPAPSPAPQVAPPTPQPGHGKCPPGLAKKNNGCLPPGHAK